MSDRMITCVMHTESGLQRLRIVLLVSVALCCAPAAPACGSITCRNCPPASPAIVSFDLQGIDQPHLLALVSLQGLVNATNRSCTPTLRGIRMAC